MANAGAKKRVEENRKRLLLLKRLILSANGIYAVMRLMLFSSSRSWTHILALFMTSLIYAVCFQGVSSAAEPVYDEHGELMDGGADLNMGGIISTYQDLIYVSAFVQVASCLSDKFWWLFLVVPTYGGYLLWTNILQPWIFTPRQEELGETPAARKQREKLEKKQARKKVKYIR
ncbi:hypothetical protein WJX72_012347 [[Myrmecia] bisecta]|uniref:Transmembrane protein 208 n=1 Tax=[Myrmecia] bisecta TaxID=41462 RepID=A0AAW1Q827_9CHLO